MLSPTSIWEDFGAGRRRYIWGTSDVRSGSKAALTAPKSNFRFTPESGLRSDIVPCPKSARNGSEATRAYGSASRGDNLFDPCQPRILFRADPVVASKRWRPLDLENTALSPPFFD